MSWERTWEPDLTGLSQDQLRELVYGFSPSPNGMKVKDMNRQGIGLGDIVSYGWKDGYADATVSQVHKDGTVDLFRVYVHTADFSASGRQEGSSSVICYIGTEESKNVNPDNVRLIRKGKTLR